MIVYVLKRLALAIVIVAISALILFSALKLIPGDPATIMLGSRATPEMRQAITLQLGLDQPVPIQLFHFAKRLFSGDLGTDMWSNRSVGTIVSESLPNTLLLIVCGLGWAAALGIPLGCWSAIKKGSVADGLVGILSVATISIPSFVVAIYAILVFSVRLKWLPAIGAGEAGDLRDQTIHLVLPAFALGLGWVGYLARIVRASMLEVLGESHVRTAKAFGLSTQRIIFSYALPIAVIPVLTILALSIGSLLSSAVLIEAIFARPGIGKVIVDAAAMRNIPVVEGAVLTTVALYALTLFLADLLIAALDPRIRERLR